MPAVSARKRVSAWVAFLQIRARSTDWPGKLAKQLLDEPAVASIRSGAALRRFFEDRHIPPVERVYAAAAELWGEFAAMRVAKGKAPRR